MKNGNTNVKESYIFERKYLKVFIQGLHLILNIQHRLSFALSIYSTGRWNDADESCPCGLR